MNRNRIHVSSGGNKWIICLADNSLLGIAAQLKKRFKTRMPKSLGLLTQITQEGEPTTWVDTRVLLKIIGIKVLKK